MRFIKENVKQFARAKAVTYSEHYIVCSTGGQIKIFDKDFNLLQTIKGVRYVYKCIISPDEKNLLLISITNCFYVVELDTFGIAKHTIKGKYDGNLEGNGCWSLDSYGCCFCVTSKLSSKSALRIYDDIKKDVYRELLCDKYWLTSILAVPQHNKYLLTGFDYTTDKSYLIWYDGSKFEEFPVSGLSECDAVMQAKFYEKGACCIVIGSENTVLCSTEGQLIKRIDLREQSSLTYSFMDILKSVDMKEKDRQEIADLSKHLGLEGINVPDQIMNVCYSSDERYFYIATLGSLLCVDAQTYEIKAEKKYSFGIKTVEEFREELLLVTTWDSVEFLRLSAE